MNCNTRAVAWAIAFALCSSPCAAAEHPLTLTEVRAIALAHSPLAKAIDSDYAVKVAESIETRTLPNPELEIGVGVPVKWDNERGDEEVEVSITQPFRLSHFGERKSVSQLIAKSASIEQKADLLKLLKEVDLAYGRLWILQQQGQLYARATKTGKSRLVKIREGVRRGVLSKGDEKLFEAGLGRIEADQIGLKGDAKIGEAKLFNLIGSSSSVSSLAKPELSKPLELEEVLRKESNSPIGILQRLDLMTELAVNQARLAHSDAIPELSPHLLISRSNEGVTFLGAGITIPLPLNNNNQAEIMKRERALRSAEARQRYAKGDGFRGEIAALVVGVNLTLEQARVIDTKVIPALSQSLLFQEQQFDAGSGSLVQMWQIQEELNNSQLQSLELWAKSFSARIELEVLLGREL